MSVFITMSDARRMYREYAAVQADTGRPVKTFKIWLNGKGQHDLKRRYKNGVFKGKLEGILLGI